MPINLSTNKPVLVTGTAGFIGYHLAKRLLNEGKSVIGLDNLNDYYDVNLKKARLGQIIEHPNFTFHKMDIADREAMAQFFREQSFDLVLHMAAQAGVRYSLENPHAYIDSNLVGFTNILEGSRHNSVKHLVFASSSSVYGANTKMPFSIHQNVDHPVSLYAATKKANELMAHSYSHIYELPCTGLRFFTVYGPWGRPDMALFLFTRAILANESIDVFNYGDMMRDFTYVDDIVEGVLRVANRVPTADPSWDGGKPDPGTSLAPYKVYNIGNHSPVRLMDLIGLLEDELGKTAERNMMPLQPGDVPATYADIQDLSDDVDFTPRTLIQDGVHEFVKWYREFYGV